MKVRVAMLSKWHVHAAEYAGIIQSFEDAQITCVWDEDEKRGKEWAQELKVDFEKDLDTLLGREDVDAVIVDTATTAHKEVITKAVAAGKHVFTEKVLANTLKEAKEMEEAIEKADVKFCISYPQRITSHILYTKKMIDEGILGKISLLRIRNAHGGASDNWLPGYWYNLNEAGGGAMMDLGAHPNYQATYFLGKPKRVAAMFNDIVGNGDTEDNAVSVFEFENGALAILETGFVTPFSPWRLELMGTEGTLIIEEKKVKIKSRKLPVQGWVEVEESEMPSPLAIPMRQWIDGITKGTPIIFDIKEAIPLSRMMDFAYRSHKNQTIVTIDE